MNPRRIVIMSVIYCLLPLFCVAETDETDDFGVLGFLSGEYTLIGKKIDSSDTYSGRVRFQYDEKAGVLNMTREIGGRIVTGTASLEPVLGGETRVLRLRFTQDGMDYEGTFLWQGDLDNYGRLSGYIYIRGSMPRDPGLEAYFIHSEDE